MLILILIDVQSSQKAVFTFEKGLNHQNYSLSGSLYIVKKPPAKFLIPPANPDYSLENPGFQKILLDPLEIPRPKTKTPWFLIHPWKFHMLFQIPLEIPYPQPPCLFFSGIAHTLFGD